MKAAAKLSFFPSLVISLMIIATIKPPSVASAVPGNETVHQGTVLASNSEDGPKTPEQAGRAPQAESPAGGNDTPQNDELAEGREPSATNLKSDKVNASQRFERIPSEEPGDDYGDPDEGADMTDSTELVPTESPDSWTEGTNGTMGENTDSSEETDDADEDSSGSYDNDEAGEEEETFWFDGLAKKRPDADRKEALQSGLNDS
uniref:Putative secreted protein n=1 Tax=Ixodes ricinus TaxID=34613 RepID=A0A6B0V202_IXORI